MSGTPAPARRRAATPRRVRGTASAALAAVLVVGTVVIALLTPGGTGATPTRATTETGQLVDHTLLACPDLAPARKVDTTAALGLVPAAADPQLGPGGPVQVGPIGGTSRSVDLARGDLYDASPASGPRAEATGDAAAGLFGFRLDKADQSLGVASCPAPRAQWWFTAAGAGLDHSSTLDLANVDSGPAVLDITVLGPDGPVDTVGTKGITLAPGTRRSIDLSQIAPQTDDLALSVRAERGRVVASMDDRYAAKAGSLQGQEWLSGTDRPSRVVRLAGVPAAARTRSLFVANPGDLDAIVRVRVSGQSGTFTPTGLDSVTVSPGSVQQVDLTKVLPKKEAATVLVTSRAPVLASLRAAGRGDHAYAAPVLPLELAGSAPLPQGVDTTVQLTAGGVAAKATVTAYDAKGARLDGTTLSLGATATLAWSPKKSAVKRGGYLVVAPVEGSGHVHGAVTYDDGPGIASLPLVSLPIRQLQPAVRPGVR